MAYQVPLGQKIESITINRSNVAEGFPGRAVMLGDNCVFGKILTYDDRIKRSIEVDQDAILKYGFDKVFTYYYILIARLNTDNRGNVVSDDVTVEYLRLSENQWDELTTSMNEMGSFSSLLLTKVTKKGSGGKDYSYVEVKLSNYSDIPESVFAKVDKMVNTPDFIQNVWNMVDVATSISIQTYEEKLKEYFASQQNQLPQAGSVTQQLPPQTTAPVQTRTASQPPKRIIQSSSPVQQIKPVQQVTKTPSGAAVISPAKVQDTSFEDISSQGNEMAGMSGDFAGDFDSGDFESPELE